jgi:acyl carrier protein
MKERVRQVVADVLGVETQVVADDFSRDNADTWDSLNHLRIVTALEQEFAITLSMDEIVAVRNVGQVIELIARRSVGK